MPRLLILLLVFGFVAQIYASEEADCDQVKCKSSLYLLEDLNFQTFVLTRVNYVRKWSISAKISSSEAVCAMHAHGLAEVKQWEF